jgi:hypothetical protein
MNELDDYLRANRAAFTREALTRRLVEEGHDPADVEEAWARIETDPTDRSAPNGEPVQPPTGKAGIGTAALIVLAVLVYGGAIIAAVATISYGGAVSVLMIVYVIAMLSGLVYSVRTLLASPTRGVGWAPIWGAVGLAFVIFVGLSGACFAALGPAINASRTVY